MEQEAGWQTPDGSRWMRPGQRARIRKLWRLKKRLLEVVDSQPRTLCHRDVNPNNLFYLDKVNTERRLVAIDWPTVGHGGLGEDLAALVTGTAFSNEYPWERIRDLELVVLEAYGRGLRDAGASFNPVELRRAYAAATVLRWAFDPLDHLGNLFQRVQNTRTCKSELMSRIRTCSGILQHVWSLGEEVLGPTRLTDENTNN